MITTNISELRGKCELVSSEEVNSLVSLLDNELASVNRFNVAGIGLAAPQIGIKKKVAIIRIGSIKIDLVNCSIDEQIDLVDSREGCLSLPGKSCLIKRYNEIVIKDNFLGNVNNFVAFGLVAHCVQHELDHLQGILMIDKNIENKPNIGDNMPCICGSGIKYKKCCKGKK